MAYILSPLQSLRLFSTHLQQIYKSKIIMHAITVKFSQNRLCRQTENLTVSNLYRFNSFVAIKKTVTGVEMGFRFFLFLSIFLSAHINLPYKSGAWLQGGHGGHDPPPLLAPQTRTNNQTRTNSSNFKNQENFFLRVFRNYTDKKFHGFYRVCYNFWTMYSDFSFFLTSQGKQTASRWTL